MRVEHSEAEQIRLVILERLLRLRKRRASIAHLIAALRDRFNALIGELAHARTEALRVGEVGAKIRLEIVGVEDREHISTVHDVAFANVNRHRRFGQRCFLYGDVLVRCRGPGERFRKAQRRFRAQLKLAPFADSVRERGANVSMRLRAQ